MIFFISDTHWGHANIIKYTQRPFSTVEEMDEALIANWNAVVGPKDTVYHLGDVAVCSRRRTREILDRVNGRLNLICGNHDSAAKSNTCSGRFESIESLGWLELDDISLVLCHYPMESWRGSNGGSWHLHGHSHGCMETPLEMLRMDVGIDATGVFAPMAWEQVKSYMQMKEGVLLSTPGFRELLGVEMSRARKMIDWGPNWDDEGSMPVSKETLDRAEEFLLGIGESFERQWRRQIPVPEIMPGPAESLDIRWKLPARELILNFPASPAEEIMYFGDDVGFSAGDLNTFSVKGKGWPDSDGLWSRVLFWLMNRYNV